MHSFDDNSLKKPMQIIGIGTDLCALSRIKEIYNKHQNHFLKRVFHPQEIEIFKTLSDAKKIPFLTKRFATKEAVSKALGTGIGASARLTEIACLHESYQPIIKTNGITHNTALTKASEHNFSSYKWHVSLSFEQDYALSFVILQGCA